MKKSDWKAKWIWLDYITPWMSVGEYTHRKLLPLKDEEKNRWGLFRKEFTLPSEFSLSMAEQAKIHISVDSRYKLYINGKYVGRGIYRCNALNWYYDTYDISSFLQSGENVISVLAHFYGANMSWYESWNPGNFSNPLLGKGQLIFQAEIIQGNKKIIIASDNGTKGCICNAWVHTTTRIWVGLPFLEIFDSKLMPVGWNEIDFAESDGPDWNHIIELNFERHWPILVPCDIPRLSESKIIPESLLSMGYIEPAFDEEDVEESQNGDDEPIDFVIQLNESSIVGELVPSNSQWTQNPELKLELGEKSIGCVFDMGKEVSGFIYFELESDSPDIILDFGWSEKLNENLPMKRPQFRSFAEKHGSRYICKQGINKHEFFHWNGFRYFQVNFSNPNPKLANVKLISIGVNLYLYPVDEIGQFKCNDSKINKLYDVCRWTLRNCMHDGYEDCPSREQRQWIGDAYPEIMVNYALFGDTKLAQKLIRQVGQSQLGDGLTKMVTPGDIELHGCQIIDYCLYWISIIYQDYWYTGDSTLIFEQFPRILVAIRWFLNYVDFYTGLVTDVPYWTFIDWSSNDTWGASCALNAQIYNSLNQIVEMAELIGWEKTVVSFKEIAKNIADGINKYLWDEERGAYVDAVQVDPKGEILRKSRKITFHSNTFVLLYGVAPKDRVKQVIDNVFDQPYENLYVKSGDSIWKNVTSPIYDEEKHRVVPELFFMHNVNQMFAKVGRFDQIMRYFRDAWIKMIDMGATTLWETWSNHGSLCHAWGTTPAYDLSTHCLGVQFSKSGGKEIILSPHPMGLDWAEGTVPSTMGVVKVRWEWNRIEKAFKILYSIPEGVNIIIKPPEFDGIEKISETKEQDKNERFIQTYHYE
jgi:alpha-L-rhamnosidase